MNTAPSIRSREHTSTWSLLRLRVPEQFENFQLQTNYKSGVSLRKVEKNKLDETMMRKVRRTTRDADIVLAIVDASSGPEDALAVMQPEKLWFDQPWALVRAASYRVALGTCSALHSAHCSVRDGGRRVCHG